MSKKYEVSATWTMAGSYYFEENSLFDAVKRAEANCPLPEEREYVSDSFTVDDMMELMETNGWDADILSTLSVVPKNRLIEMVEGQDDDALLTVDGATEISAGTIRAYLNDLYGSGCFEPQTAQEPQVLPETPAAGQAKPKYSPELLVKAEQVLVDNGIAADEAQTVLQALGYVLLNEELYPEA